MKIGSRRVISVLTTFISFSVLTACGGGGGGGGSSSGGGNGNVTPTFGVTYDVSTVSITAVKGTASAVVVINATGNGPAPDSLYVGATQSGVGIVTPMQVVINTVTQSATITLMPNTALAVGTYTGTLTLMACKDSACGTHYRGSPFQVPYTVNILPQLAASPQSVVSTTAETTMGTPVPVTVTLPNTSSSAMVSVAYQQGQNWLTVDNQGASITLKPDARALLAGTYNATVQLQVSNPTQSVSVPVALTVSPALTTTTDIAVTLSGQSVPSSMQGNLAVTAVTGATVPTWTATSDAAWLKLDQSSGSTGQNVTWHFDATTTAALQNFATHTAHIAISAGTTITPRTTTLQLTKQLPEITSVDRFALLSGQAGPVMVYGKGFSTLANSIGNLQITGTAANSITVLSDRALIASLPSLSANDYDVTLVNALSMPTRTKKLSVLAPIDRTYQTISTQGRKQTLIWDPLTQSAYTMNRDLDSVMRFDLSGTLSVTAKSVASLRTIGFPRDHSALLGADASGSLFDLNTADLSTVRTRQLGGAVYELSLSLPIPITGDNLAWFTGATSFGSTGPLVYDLDLSQVMTVPMPSNANISFNSGPWASVSPNGRRMLMTQSSSISPNPPMLYWDTVEGKINAFSEGAPIQFFYQSGVDRDGQRWLLDGNAVRGFDLAKLGNITLPTGWYGSHSAMSRDGTRAYVYALSDSAIGTYSEPTPITVWPRVYVLDTTGPLVATTDYPVLGYIELSDYPACRATQGPDVCNAYGVEFTLTDDDCTLLVVGDRKFIVIPVPSLYRSP